jgi:hypothetical protein
MTQYQKITARAKRTENAITTWLTVLSPLVLIALYSWPASFWFEVDQMEVTDGYPGENLVIFDREIDRAFHGSYHVEIRDVSREIICTGGDTLQYVPESTLPERITLDWWSNGGCNELPPGVYTLSTTWVIDEIPLFNKRVTARSKPFTVVDPTGESKTQIEFEQAIQEQLIENLQSETRSLKIQIDTLIEEITK